MSCCSTRLEGRLEERQGGEKKAKEKEKEKEKEKRKNK
jgi:hypothetical protein